MTRHSTWMTAAGLLAGMLGGLRAAPVRAAGDYLYIPTYRLRIDADQGDWSRTAGRIRELGGDVRYMRGDDWIIGCDSADADAIAETPGVVSIVEYVAPTESGETGAKAQADKSSDEGPVAALKADVIERGTGENSTYLIGRVVVNAFFLTDRPGRWTEEKRTAVLEEVAQGLAGPDLEGPDFGVATHYNHRFNCNLTFEVIAGGEVVVPDDPISRTAGELIGAIGDVAGQWGYGQSAAGIGDFNAEQRGLHGADMSFCIFFVDDTDDDDHALADGRSAFVPWANGPFIVLTQNNGAWGLRRLNRVFVHEMHHVFGALDKYSSSASAPDETSGYLDVANGGSDGWASLVGIMRNPDSGVLSEFTLGQVGVVLPGSPADDVPDALQHAAGARLLQNQFAVRVDAWVEEGAGGDGIPDPGERGQFLLTVVNDTYVAMRDVQLDVVAGRGLAGDGAWTRHVGDVAGPSQYPAESSLAIDVTVSADLAPGDPIELATTLHTGQKWYFSDTVVLSASRPVESAEARSVLVEPSADAAGVSPVEPGDRGVMPMTTMDAFPTGLSLAPAPGCGMLGMAELLGAAASLQLLLGFGGGRMRRRRLSRRGR